MKDLDIKYRKMTESLRLLSSPYKEQIKCFPEFVDVPVEVLETFDDAYFFLPDLVEENRLSNIVISNLLRLRSSIDFTVSKPNLKNLEEEQFSTHTDWENIRQQSKDVLKLMNEPMGNPDLEYI